MSRITTLTVQMGAEFDCFCCGAPLNSTGEFYSDIKLLQEICDDAGAEIDFLRGQTADQIVETLEEMNATKNQLSKLQKSLVIMEETKKYNWLSKVVILTGNGKVIKGTAPDSWEIRLDQPESMLEGFSVDYVIHQDCYELLQDKYGEFNTTNIISWSASKERREIDWQLIMCKTPFILESPLENKKNCDRILALDLPICLNN